MIGHYAVAAVRNFRRNPLATAIKLLALSLGLICFLTAYVFADFVGRADTHWANAGRIFSVTQHSGPPSGGPMTEMTQVGPPVAKYLRLDAPEIEAVARLTSYLRPTLTDRGGDNVQMRAADPELLQIFDLPFVAGDDRALSQPRSAILSARVARSLFGDVRSAMGQSLTLEVLGEASVTVTGVIGEIRAPSSLGAPFGSFDMLVTMDVRDDLMMAPFSPPPDMSPEQIARAEANRSAFRPSEVDDWMRNFASVYVLLPRQGMTPADLERRLNSLAARHVPADRGRVRFEAVSLESAMSNMLDRYVMYGVASGLSLRGLLLGFGSVVLGIACLNFANLTTAEAAARGREIGLRKTIGAGRTQIVVQTLTETALLAAAAMAVMLIVLWLAFGAWDTAAEWGLNAPSLERPGFWLGLAGIVAAVSVLAGAYPALVLSGIAPVAAAHAGGPAGGGLMRMLLTGTQFAAAAALLAGVFVIYLQNAELRRAGPGAIEEPVLIVTPNSNTGVISSSDLPALETLRAELATDPAVVSATLGNVFAGGVSSGQNEVSLSPDAGAPAQPYQGRGVQTGYFATLNTPLLAGRDFRDGDDALNRVIIDAGTAANFGFTPAEAVGRTLYMFSPTTSFRDGQMQFERQVREAEIIGVVEEPPMELRASAATNFVYELSTFGFMFLVRLSADDVAGGLSHVREAFGRLTPDMQYNYRFLDEEFELRFRMFNRITAGLMALCLMAVAIAAMGLFGMASFVVQRRIREIGVRKTLGAGSLRVLGMLLWDFSKPVLVANVIAWPVAWMASQTYLNLFADRIALTPWPFLAALLVSLAVAWLAVGAQAVRAARAKPARVLQAV